MSVHKSRCAVCGNNIEDVVRQTHGSEEYHFCCDNCRMEFLNNPGDYEKVWEYFRKDGFDVDAIKCAVCGHKVSEEVAVKQEYNEEDSNEKYFFCTEKHRMEFISDPTTYKGLSGKHLS